MIICCTARDTSCSPAFAVRYFAAQDLVAAAKHDALPGVRFLGQCAGDTAGRAVRALRGVQEEVSAVFADMLSSQMPGVLLRGE